MKRYIKTFLIAGVTLFSACDDFFELDRPEVEPWQTVSDLQPVVSSAYKSLFSLGGWTNPLSKVSNYTEFVHDMSFVNPWAMWTEIESVYRREASAFPSSGYAIGKCMPFIYTSISSSNLVIEFMERNRKADGLFEVLSPTEEAEYNKLLGEAYFMRSYAYWIASQMFMPPYHPDNRDKVYIPLVTVPRSNIEDLKNPPMGTMGQVFDTMLEDFAIAKDLLPESNRQGHANKFAASAMLMRLTFITGDWDQTKKECDFIIEKGPYTLEEEPIRAFNRNIEQVYTANPIAKEVIFEAVQTAEDTGVRNAVPSYARVTKNGQWNFKTKEPSQGAIELAVLDNWTGGGRNYIDSNGKNIVNWQHSILTALMWNPYTLKYIGWCDTDDIMSAEYQPNAEALKDLRFTQLNYFLKGNRGQKDNPAEYEMCANFQKIKFNNFWPDKYLRAPFARASLVPLIRLPEVYLTRASVDPNNALNDVNIVRARAGIDPLSSVTEKEVEIERMKELAFEHGDRLVYLAAMRREIPANGKRLIDGADTEEIYNPTTSGDLIPSIQPPYSTTYFELPDLETLFSDSSN